MHYVSELHINEIYLNFIISLQIIAYLNGFYGSREKKSYYFISDLKNKTKTKKIYIQWFEIILFTTWCDEKKNIFDIKI